MTSRCLGLKASRAWRITPIRQQSNLMIRENADFEITVANGGGCWKSRFSRKKSKIGWSEMSRRLGKIVYRASWRGAVFAKSQWASFSTATPVLDTYPPADYCSASCSPMEPSGG